MFHVLAKKINLPHEDFMIIKQAVYMLHFLDYEKVWPGAKLYGIDKNL